MSCVRGSQKSHLCVAGVNCYTGAQCGASAARKGHGRAAQMHWGHQRRLRTRPSSTAATASGGEGRQCRRLPPAMVSRRAASRQPGAAQVQPWGGDLPRAVPGPLKRYCHGPAVMPPPSTSCPPLQTASPETPPPGSSPRPPGSRMEGEGGVGVWHWGGVVAVGFGDCFYFRYINPVKSPGFVYPW